MARKKKDDQITEEKLAGFLAAQYIIWSLGLLDPEKEEKLESLPGPSDWKEAAEEVLGVNDSMIRALFAVLRIQLGESQALAFLMRGFRCEEQPL